MIQILKKIIKFIGTILCAFLALSFGGTVFFSEFPIINIIFTIIFLLLTILLVHSPRKNKNSGQTQPKKKTSKTRTVSPYLPEVPMETLRDMRKYYSAAQAEGDARIMQESFHLIQQTTDFDTFFSRLELAQKKALTLLQAAQAKCKGVNREKTVQGCEAVLSSVQNAKVVFLDNTYTRETESALQLKTKSGQYKRLEKYLEKLQSNEDQFRDVNEVFAETVSKLQDLMTSIQPADKPSKPHVKSEVAVSAANEILKFKQLLDAGAITQAEYEAKKSQLLGL